MLEVSLPFLEPVRCFGIGTGDWPRAEYIAAVGYILIPVPIDRTILAAFAVVGKYGCSAVGIHEGGTLAVWRTGYLDLLERGRHLAH